MFKASALSSFIAMTFLGAAAMAQTPPVQGSGGASPPMPPATSWPMPPSSAAPPYSLMARHQQLRDEIGWLSAERRQYGIGGPIVMLAGGGGVALSAAYLYLLTQHVEDHCTYDCEDDLDNSDFKTGLVVIGAAGLVVGVIGLVKLQANLGPRRRLGEQIKFKRAELQSLDTRIRLAPIIGPMSLRGVSVGLSF